MKTYASSKIVRGGHLCILAFLIAYAGGCRQIAHRTDQDVGRLIEKRQKEVLGFPQPVALEDADDPTATVRPQAYQTAPHPRSPEIPPDFDTAQRGKDAELVANLEPSPTANIVRATASRAAATEEAAEQEQTRFRERPFTLTEALAYAQQHRRGLQTAKEDLYLSALALTLEHHLWTPQFSSGLRGVYGNYGEIRNFDQATRYVAELSAAQRLPYGGQFTAAMISTLVRDIGRGITASESSQLRIGFDIPLLRGAGHVAREELTRLERELTYAVRTYERFRRRQLVDVSRQYFSLLASKQAVIDATTSLSSAERDLQRAIDMQRAGDINILDLGRAETRLLQQQNNLARSRETFRAAVDQFKIVIGMPLEEGLGRDDLESIESIEQRIEEGLYPLLRLPPAASNADYAVRTAEENRLDLLNIRDRIDDAERGITIARNALLPNLDWTSNVTYDTDPEHYKLGAFEDARATWRSELLLSMNDRFRERNTFRSSMIDAHRARRNYEEQAERVRAEVLSAINQIALQRQLVSIQQRVLDVADQRRQYARTMVDLGKLGNRDLVEAEDAHIAALNALNLAKTDQWTSLLNFRLATGTLRVDESGRQVEAASPHTTAAREGAGSEAIE